MQEKNCRVVISARLIMYGSVTVCLESNIDKSIASYIAIADGGAMVSQGEKEYEGISVTRLIDRIVNDFSIISEADDGVVWKLFCDENESVLIDIDEIVGGGRNYYH